MGEWRHATAAAAQRGGQLLSLRLLCPSASWDQHCSIAQQPYRLLWPRLDA